MILDFQQGIVTYPTASGLQTFLAYSGGYVSLQTTNGRVDITFAHGLENYLLSESSSVPNAWGPLSSGVDYWLYWDIDLRTGVRTFGATQLAPSYGPSFVGAPTQDQHWFDTSARKMYVYDTGAFRNVLRVFAAKINTSTFTPLGTGFPSFPYAGTQAGLNIAGSKAGRIIVDDSGNPVRRVDGRFFTSESDFFVNGSPVNTIRLEANIIAATAVQPLAKFQVVKIVAFGKIAPCTYDDIGQTAIAMLMENLNAGQTGTVCVQGYVTNPAWNWASVGAPLWTDDTGALVETDPHVDNAFVYPQGRVPIARVFSPTSVFFDQGLGGKGDQGIDGAVSGVQLATTTIFGISKLSTPASDIGNPIVVGDNDVRLSNKVLKAGDTMTGTLFGTTLIGSNGVSTIRPSGGQGYTYMVPDVGATRTGALYFNSSTNTPIAAIGWADVGTGQLRYTAYDNAFDGRLSLGSSAGPGAGQGLFTKTLELTPLGTLITNGTPGTAGQVLSSTGPGTPMQWITADRTPRFQRIIATAAQTVVNTTINLQSSAAPLLRIQVFLNGILQIEGAGESFTVTGATQITFSTPLALSDDVVVVSYVL